MKKTPDDSGSNPDRRIYYLKKRKMINKKYSGAIVLGLNDALVEMTGALVGLTFALKDPKIIAITGLITGVAASLSMAASEYLAVREDSAKEKKKSSLKKAFYTGTTYIVAVLILISPYIILNNVYTSLMITLSLALCLIAFYTLSISKENKIPPWKRFIQMATITIAVSIISFVVGILLKYFVL